MRTPTMLFLAAATAALLAIPVLAQTRDAGPQFGQVVGVPPIWPSGQGADAGNAAANATAPRDGGTADPIKW
jgi:hypothetical protein